MSAFSTWLDTFVDEKGYDLEHQFHVDGSVWGRNVIPLGVVIETAKKSPAGEQREIKAALAKIDRRNGDALQYFGHLAQGMAK